jgi:hypothetical protein
MTVMSLGEPPGPGDRIPPLPSPVVAGRYRLLVAEPVTVTGHHRVCRQSSLPALPVIGCCYTLADRRQTAALLTHHDHHAQAVWPFFQPQAPKLLRVTQPR